MSHVPLVLASSSPRRRELVERVGIPVEIRPAHVDERPLAGELPEPFVRRVAALKAEAVAAALPGRWVLAADTIVVLGDEILGKARDEAEARRMLDRLLGRWHRVITAFCVVGPGEVKELREVVTEVAMRAAGNDEIDSYVAAGEWRGKAGAYAIQGMAASLVTQVRGSVTNVVGLPLAEVAEVLRTTGVHRIDYREGRPA